MLTRERPHEATEVYVTGTFDSWAKTEKLTKVGHGFEGTVRLPNVSEKIFYKVLRISLSAACRIH